MMDLKEYIGKWGTANLGINSVHQDDVEVYKNYPFKGQWHKCVDIDEKFLVLKFSCIKLRVIFTAFNPITTPPFLPLEEVQYLSSKKVHETGTIIGYASKWKPKISTVFIIARKGKIKSTLYPVERLSLMHRALPKLTLADILDCLDILSSERSWISFNIVLDKLNASGKFEKLYYYDILRVSDNSDNIQIKAEIDGPEYRKNFNWYMR